MAYSFGTSAIDLLSNRSDSNNLQDFVSDLVVRSLILAQGMQSVTAMIDTDTQDTASISRIASLLSETAALQVRLLEEAEDVMMRSNLTSKAGGYHHA